jgi:transcriptional regulator with XRE-family HTH domain
MTIPPPRLGAVIRQRRLDLGWSQEELAARVSELGSVLRQSDISRLELGKVDLPRRERLVHLAVVLELSVGELLLRSGWAGAEWRDQHPADIPKAGAALDVAQLTADAEASAAPARQPERPMARDGRLADLLVQAQQTRARTAEVLQHSQTIWELANRPFGGPGRVDPGR